MKAITKGFAKISLFVLALTIFAVSASYVMPAFAAHTASVSLDKTFVRGGASDTYSFTVTKGSGDNIQYTYITIPDGFTYNSATCPFDWNPVYTPAVKILKCDGEFSLQHITTSADVKITASSPSNEGASSWTVKTKDINSVTETLTPSPTTTVDNTAPTTTDSGTDADWHNTQVTVTLAPTDGSSGVDNTYYTTDEAVPTTSSSQGTSIVLSTTGIYTIKYFSTDKVGNAEAVKTAINQVKIDTVLPTTTSSLTGTLGTNDWYTSDVQVTLSASDVNSGVSTTKYKIDAGTEQTYSSSFPISTEGTHSVSFYSVDVAGNTEVSKLIEVKIDKTVPQITVTAENKAITTGESTSISVTASDAISNVASTKIYLDGDTTGTDMTKSGDIYTYVFNTPLNSIASHAYYIIVKDVAGLETKDPVGTYVITVTDNDAPVFGIDATPTSATTGDSFTISVPVSDNIGVSLVDVEYWYGSGTHTTEAMGLNADKYEKQIVIPSDKLDSLHYIFHAKDAANNEKTTTQKDVTVTDNDVPSAPGVLIHSDSNSNVGYDRDITLDFSWTAAIDNIGVTGYKVYIWNSVSGDYDAGTNVGNVLAYALTGVNGVSYNIKVSAFDAAGNEGPTTVSSVVNVDTVAPVFSGTTPASNSYIKAGFAVDYTLSESIVSGTIKFNYGIETQTYTMNSVDFIVGSHVIQESSLTGVILVDGRTYTISFDGTDAAGNPAATVTNTNIIYDTTAPVIASHDDITAEATSSSGAIVTYTSPATYDNVDVDGTSSCLPVSGSTFLIGTTTVTCSATDKAGNSAIPTTFAIKVQDKTPPTITAPSDKTKEATSALTTVELGSPIVSDLVDPSPVVTNDALASFPVGTTTVTWTAKDASGNSNTAIQKITITDKTAPVISGTPSDITTEATSSSGATVTYTYPTASDIVDGSIIPTCSPISGSTFALGDTAVTCTAADTSGNTGSSTFHIVVRDTTSPTIDVIETITAEATSPSGTTVTYTSPATHDAVDGDSVAICTPASGSTFSLGTNIITCTKTDAVGNTATSHFNIIVQDTTLPTVGAISITPSHTAGGNTYIPSSATIKATVSDSGSGLNTATCQYTLNANDVTPIWNDASYNLADNTCYAAITTTSGATSHINIRVADARGNIGKGSAVTTETDAVAPIASNFVPANNSFTNDETPLISVDITDVPSGVDASTITMTVGVATVTPTKTAISNGYRVSYTPTSPFADATSVAVSVSAKDNSGNSMVPTSWSFTIDLTAPSILSRTPGINAVGVDPSSNITIRFNEHVNIISGNIVLQYGANIVPIGFEQFNDGYEVNITSETPLDSNKGYTITLSGITDRAGNLLPTDIWSFTTATHYEISLTKGWNLISLPIVPTSTNIENVLGSEKVNIDTVWAYDANDDKWSMYALGGGSNNLGTMTAGNGYWISYTKDTVGNLDGWGNLFLEGANTPPQTTLTSGWNLIGYYQRENTDSIKASCALKTLRDPDSETSKWWTMLTSYDNENKQFGGVGFGDNMNPGQGYWILMTSKLNTYKYGPGLSASECVV